MRKEYAEYLLKKTREDYNFLYLDYTRTRAFIPEDIKNLAKYALPGERVLDSGCGNGRLLEVLREVDYYGIDFSKNLIELAKEKYPQGKFFLRDALTLPFPDNFFDKVFSISVLHHIPSKEFRLKYLKEIFRVLKPGGKLILRVWDLLKRKGGKKLFLKYAFLKIIGKTKLDFFDIFVPWKDSKGRVLVQRYFHCFRKKELINLAKRAGFKVIKIWRAGEGARKNIYLILEKPP